MSDQALIQVQASKQTAFATAVTPYTVKRMLGDLGGIEFTPIRDVKRFPDMRGSLAPAHIAALTRLGVGAGMLKGVASYEDAPYDLDAIFGVATPTGADPYVYDYAAPGSAIAASPRLQSFGYGESVDDIIAITGALATKLQYTCKHEDALMFNLSMLGYDIADQGSLAVLSDRTVTPIMAGDIAVTIDAWGGTIGTTAFAANVYSLDFTVDTKRDVRWYLGSYNAGGYKEPVKWDGTLKLVLEFVAASPNTKALLHSFTTLAAGSVFNKQIRMKATNGALIWQLDFAGVSEKAPKLFTYDNGIETLELDLVGQYNPTLANWCKAEVTNHVATLA